MEKCKICGKEFVKINVQHLKTHDTDQETYDKLPEFVPKEVSITKDEKEEKIFGKPLESIEKPLEVFLHEFGITEKELRELVRSYKTGNAIDVVQDIERKQKYGEKHAEQLKDDDLVETSKLLVADALVHKHGFIVTEVTSNPKIWKLKKIN